MKRLRQNRVASLMQAELAQIIQMELFQPILKWVTVTGLKVSPDLSYADVKVVARDEAQAEQVLDSLKAHGKFLRHRLAEEINLRKTPELRFHYDYSLAMGTHMENLLSQFEKDLKEREQQNS